MSHDFFLCQLYRDALAYANQAISTEPRTHHKQHLYILDRLSRYLLVYILHINIARNVRIYMYLVGGTLADIRFVFIECYWYIAAITSP